ncbi:hypothetical protein NP493_1090g00017 [Ridgeia piscesae]|uniref:Uncharacterized protein n=1 Tax=Ridgeia piscesae TaxID=27915 RepID=A0AAD9KI63_RIDPI|nr:hypothetical protein NP493_1090g00017 [Ridgeia piscesae]
MAVLFAFIVCVAPAHVFYVTIPNWPMSLQDQYDVLVSLLLLRYANHAVNVFLYSLTGAHFRCEDAAATANEQSPALVRVRFTCNMLLFAERSVLVG